MSEPITEKTAEQKRVEAIVRNVREDFAARREARRSLERGWQLNMNFISGNQYCDISEAGELEEETAAYYWQSRRSFNHLAPTIDTRIARLAKVRPSLEVRAFARSVIMEHKGTGFVLLTRRTRT